MLFRDRAEAARLLAERLARYRGQRPLVLGIPRGAVPMAAIIAEALDGEVDVVLVHKLRAPRQPELAIGSVDETGNVYISEHVRELGVSTEYIEKEKEAQLERLREQRRMYTPLRPAVDAADRLVVVVDDGVATGATMIAALRAARSPHPRKLIAATAVATKDAAASLEHEADEVICLETPDLLFAVGEFFEDFSQVSDEEVIHILRDGRADKVARK